MALSQSTEDYRLKRSNLARLGYRLQHGAVPQPFRPTLPYPQLAVATKQSKQARSRASADRVIPKDVLAKEIAAILRDRELTQTEAARIMKDAPSQVSLVVTGKLRGFSTERLLRMLARLGRDIDIVIRPTHGRQRAGRISVVRK